MLVQGVISTTSIQCQNVPGFFMSAVFLSFYLLIISRILCLCAGDSCGRRHSAGRAFVSLSHPFEPSISLEQLEENFFKFEGIHSMMSWLKSGSQRYCDLISVPKSWRDPKYPFVVQRSLRPHIHHLFINAFEHLVGISSNLPHSVGFIEN